MTKTASFLRKFPPLGEAGLRAYHPNNGDEIIVTIYKRRDVSNPIKIAQQTQQKTLSSTN
ncbi:MAG: hypothetical protein K0R12_66 [Gammaproteobacteria bacterium]|jgi:hypothetical protein|nr:hypothetical protein [Gammaproteobacteria bacterium]